MTVSSLAAYHEAQMEETRRKIRDAMRSISDEIDANPERIYPYANGRLTQSEICRRAGVSRSTPKQPHQKVMAEEMRAFISRVKKRVPTSQKAIQERRKESLASLQKAIRVLAADVLVHKQRAEGLAAENTRMQNLLSVLPAKVTVGVLPDPAAIQGRTQPNRQT